MSDVERLVKKLDPLFQTMALLGTPTFLCGYTDSLEGSYTVEALARKVSDEIQMKIRLRRDWVPLASLARPELQRLTLWTWDIQHVFQDVSAGQPLANYCWCGFHEEQHVENDVCVAHSLSREECISHLQNRSDRKIYRLYERMRAAEIKLHQAGICTHPNGCELPVQK
jgi:hypothetical protein